MESLVDPATKEMRENDVNITIAGDTFETMFTLGSRVRTNYPRITITRNALPSYEMPTLQGVRSELFSMGQVSAMPFITTSLDQLYARLNSADSQGYEAVSYQRGNPSHEVFLQQPGDYMTRSELNRMSPKARVIYNIICYLEAYLELGQLEFTSTALRNELTVLQYDAGTDRELIYLTTYENLFGVEDNFLTISTENLKRLCHHCR